MSHHGLKRTRRWKRRRQPKEAYSLPGLLYSETCAKAIWFRQSSVILRISSPSFGLRCQNFMGTNRMPERRTDKARWLSTAYFVAVGCLFLSAAFVSVQRHDTARPRLRAPQDDTIGAADVLSRSRTGKLADIGLAFLIFLGPVGGIFRGSMLLAAGGVLLFLMAVLLSLRSRFGALMGVAWALGVVVLLVFAMARISVSYSWAARLLMFGPASALNIGLLVALRRLLLVD